MYFTNDHKTHRYTFHQLICIR